MKTTLKNQQIQDIMDIMLRFVSKHATLPILENIYIKAHLDSITFRATDMEKYVEIEIPAKIDDEAIITVNAKTFNDIIRTIDDEFVTLHIIQSKDQVLIETAQDNFSIKGIPASEYVAIPTLQAKGSLQVDPVTISTGISKVEYAVTEKNFSPVMTGILMRIKEYAGEKKLVFVGTDSFRLAEYKINIDQSIDTPLSVIMPKIHVVDLKKVIDFCSEKWADSTTVQRSDSMISFSSAIDGMRIDCMSLLIQGNFPEYENENIMPNTFNYSILVDKVQCEKAIRKIGTITRTLNNYISVTTGEESLEFNSWQTDVGDGKTTTSSINTGGEVRFWANGKYISDFIRSTIGNEIHIHLVSGEKPIIFKDTGDSNYCYVVRPLVK